MTCRRCDGLRCVPAVDGSGARVLEACDCDEVREAEEAAERTEQIAAGWFGLETEVFEAV